MKLISKKYFILFTLLILVSSSTNVLASESNSGKILISKAFHLDSNQNNISDIYEQVKAKDNNWKNINNGEYIRTTFEKELNSNNDITIYAKSNEVSKIEVYSKSTGQYVTSFENIKEENIYKVYLSNLQEPTDTFDLKIIGNIDFDLIIDPTLGVDWTSLPAGDNTGIEFGTTHARSIAYGDGKFVVVGYEGKASYSSDGINWTSLPAGDDTGIKFSATNVSSITYGDGKFVAVGQSGKASYSSDGINWTSLTPGADTGIKFTGPAYSIAYGDGKFVVVGESGVASYSSDGITWTSLPAGADTGIKFGVSNNSAYSITYAEGKFVVVGEYGKASYSSDGINWTSLPAGPGTGIKFWSSDARSIAYGDGKFVVVGYEGKASYSTDGINWNILTPGANTGIKVATMPAFSVGYGFDKFVVGSFLGKASYSTDAINWTILTPGNDTGIKFGTSNAVNSIVYGDGKFVAVGNGGMASYSALPTSSITPTSGPNGSITPTEVTSVNQGEDQTFTITPNTGYQIEDVLVDGTSVGTLSTYTFTNVTTDHTISATFSQIPEKKRSTTSLKTRINNLNKMGKTDKVLELQKQYNVPTITNTENKPSTNNSNPSSNSTRDLELNSTGDDVKSLQQFLNSKGYIINTPGQPGSTGYETTYFGNLTRQALIKFQQANNITPALGYYGPKTKAFIKTLLIIN